jgi:hypothetical protein
MTTEKTVIFQNPCRNCITRPICLSKINDMPKTLPSDQFYFLLNLTYKCKPIYIVFKNTPHYEIVIGFIKLEYKAARTIWDKHRYRLSIDY